MPEPGWTRQEVWKELDDALAALDAARGEGGNDEGAE